MCVALTRAILQSLGRIWAAEWHNLMYQATEFSFPPGGGVLMYSWIVDDKIGKHLCCDDLVMLKYEGKYIRAPDRAMPVNTETGHRDRSLT